ncbi:MAG: TIGR04283 family arsenosugar biosynthesis glycosyltransferase [Pseudomonadota bacterium]
MRAPISVVIPTRNAEATLPATLASLMPGLEAGLIREVVVTDAGSSDATQRIAEAAGATVVSGPPGRGGQLQRGARTARGDWLFFLHADSVLGPDWTRPTAALVRSEEMTAGYFDLQFDAHGFAPALVARWANIRSRAFGLPYGDQGLLIRRTHYDAVGGYSDQPLMEDVDMARRVGRRALRSLGTHLTTGADRYLRDGWLRRSLANGWLLTQFLAGVSPERLARKYDPTPDD